MKEKKSINHTTNKRKIQTEKKKKQEINHNKRKNNEDNI